MTRIHIFCEGQTEDVFVREVLHAHFQPMGIWLNPIIVRTGPQGKGGVVSYGKIKWQVEKKCKEDQNAWVTTLLDFYGLPKDFPAMNTLGSSVDRAKMVESAFQDDIGKRNFVANLVVHEFEGLLFSAPEAFGDWFDDVKTVSALKQIRNQYETPEDINDGKITAPSKRILKICEKYDKTMHGSLIAQDIGLPTIRQECPMFDQWIKRLEALVDEH